MPTRKAMPNSTASAAATNRVNRPTMMQMAPTVSRTIAATANVVAGSNPCLAMRPLMPARPKVPTFSQRCRTAAANANRLNMRFAFNGALQNLGLNYSVLRRPDPGVGRTAQQNACRNCPGKTPLRLRNAMSCPRSQKRKRRVPSLGEADALALACRPRRVRRGDHSSRWPAVEIREEERRGL